MISVIKHGIKNLLEAAGIETDPNKFIVESILKGIVVWIIVAVGFYIYSPEYYWYAYATAGFVFFLATEAYIINILIMKSSKRLGTVDDYVPDFLGLMASNIRSGVTYERALMMSSRKEFGPLATEIDFAAKQIVSGKPFSEALMEMAKRVNSPKFSKSIRLIVEGLNSGGNLAELLEETAYDMRRFEGLRKDITSQLLSYTLFIFAAATIGAPLLYAVAAFLISVLTSVNSNISMNDVGALGYVPGIIKGGNEVSTDLINNFSLTAILITCFFASLSGGTIFFNSERQGLIYFPIIALVAICVFYGTSTILGILFKNLATNA